MILGLGCDFVNIERLKHTQDFVRRFKQRILGPEEVEEFEKQEFFDIKAACCLLAKYYAGKEAFVKALGTGFRDGIFLKDIQILHTDLGKPYLKISGRAAEYLQKMSDKSQTFISLTDDYPFAQAVVVIEQ